MQYGYRIYDTVVALKTTSDPARPLNAILFDEPECTGGERIELIIPDNGTSARADITLLNSFNFNDRVSSVYVALGTKLELW